jgi:hypothetical protein
MRGWLLLLVVMGAPTKDMIENADGAPCVKCGNTTAKSWWKALDDTGRRRWLCAGTGEMTNRTGHAKLHHRAFMPGWSNFESAPRPAPTVSSVAAQQTSNKLLDKKTRAPRASKKNTALANAAAPKKGAGKQGKCRFVDDEAADDDDARDASSDEQSESEKRESNVTTTTEIGDEAAAARFHAQAMMGETHEDKFERAGAASTSRADSITPSSRATSASSTTSVPRAHGKRVVFSPPSSLSNNQVAQLDSSAPPTRKRANQSISDDASPAARPIANTFDEERTIARARAR